MTDTFPPSPSLAKYLQLDQVQKITIESYLQEKILKLHQRKHVLYANIGKVNTGPQHHFSVIIHQGTGNLGAFGSS
jgi:hypothetical protein